MQGAHPLGSLRGAGGIPLCFHAAKPPLLQQKSPQQLPRGAEVFISPRARFPLLLQASRAQILDKATEYIQYMRRKNHTHQQDIDDLKRQNALLEQQGERGRKKWGGRGHGGTPRGDTSWPCLTVRALEKARSSAQLQANYPSSDNSLYTNPKGSAISAFDGGSDSSSDSEPEEPQNRKKLRMEAS